MAVFSVQNETGTVAQFTLLPSPLPVHAVAVGDTGLYVGVFNNQDGFSNETTQSLLFTVTQVLDTQRFSVSAPNANLADWPGNGTITWQTGQNFGTTSTITEIDPANAYIDTSFLIKYLASRGLVVPLGKTQTNMQQSIVNGTDYLDQKYRYGGVKRLQNIGSAVIDANSVFLETWLTPYALNGVSYLTPMTTNQNTEFPRQGLVDLNGDTVNGIPYAIKAANAELAFRSLSGIKLQADYDPNIVGNGGVVEEVLKRVGPLETLIKYDTKAGLGFFASFPQVDRLLSKAGLLKSGGGRTVIR